MNHTERVMVDLLAGQSTADSIAGRLDLQAEMVEGICKYLCRNELATVGTIAERLLVYRLTDKGTEAAIYHKPPRRPRSVPPAPATPV